MGVGFLVLYNLTVFFFFSIQYAVVRETVRGPGVFVF